MNIPGESDNSSFVERIGAREVAHVCVLRKSLWVPFG